jgi:hypothetical protein
VQEGVAIGGALFVFALVSGGRQGRRHARARALPLRGGLPFLGAIAPL